MNGVNVIMSIEDYNKLIELKTYSQQQLELAVAAALLTKGNVLTEGDDQLLYRSVNGTFREKPDVSGVKIVSRFNSMYGIRVTFLEPDTTVEF